MDNPYAPPRADPAPQRDPALLALEEDRRAHINAEASVRGLGSLWLFLAALAALFAVRSAAAVVTRLRGGLGAELMEWLGYGLVAVTAAWMMVKAGFATRRLEAWTYLVALCLCAALLFAFPVGTLLGLYYLGLLLSKRGRRVFRPDYREVIAQTPHVKRTTPRTVWVAVAVIVALSLLAVGLA